jgi:hypothetical protein
MRQHNSRLPNLTSSPPPFEQPTLVRRIAAHRDSLPLIPAERQSPPVTLKVVPQGRVNGVVVVTALLLARQCVTLEKVHKKKK